MHLRVLSEYMSRSERRNQVRGTASIIDRERAQFSARMEEYSQNGARLSLETVIGNDKGVI